MLMVFHHNYPNRDLLGLKHTLYQLVKQNY